MFKGPNVGNWSSHLVTLRDTGLPNDALVMTTLGVLVSARQSIFSDLCSFEPFSFSEPGGSRWVEAWWKWLDVRWQRAALVRTLASSKQQYKEKWQEWEFWEVKFQLWETFLVYKECSISLFRFCCIFANTQNIPLNNCFIFHSEHR